MKGLVPVDAPGGSGPVLYSDRGIHYRGVQPLHHAVVGQTQRGKTTSVTIPQTLSCIAARECCVVLDAKGSVFNATAAFAQERSYKIRHIDFSSPRNSPDTFNPIRYIYDLFCSDSGEDQDLAAEILRTVIWNLVPDDDDMFWPLSATDLLCGLTHALLQCASPFEVNPASLQRMMAEMDVTVARSTIIKEFVGFQSGTSQARALLSSYATAAHETQASIRAVTFATLSRLLPNDGVTALLSSDTLRLSKLDVDIPWIIYITIPDERSSVYGPVAGVLLTLLSSHLFRLSRKYQGRLPRPVTFILEELFCIGRGTLQLLPDWLSAGLGRNVRYTLCLQSMAQLDSLYTPACAKTIRDNIGCTIAFSGADPEGLSILSDLCGRSIVNTRNEILDLPVITPRALASLRVGEALILRPDGLCYVTQLPKYSDAFRLPKNQADLFVKPRLPYKAFSLEAYVLKKREDRLNELLNQKTDLPPLKKKLEEMFKDFPNQEEKKTQPPQHQSTGKGSSPKKKSSENQQKKGASKKPIFVDLDTDSALPTPPALFSADEDDEDCPFS